MISQGKNLFRRSWVASSFVVMTVFLFQSTAFAEKKEYDFSWLDPEKKIYVLQNRKFLKKKKLLLSVLGGTELSGAYRTTFNLDSRIGYYFNEAWGIEALYVLGFHNTNNVFKALENATVAVPQIREVQSMVGAMADWAPWYAKINVFNNIIYFDWYFAAGAGSLQTDLDTNTKRGGTPVIKKETRTAILVATGHQYHLSRRVTIRLDFTGAYYKAPLFGDTGEDTWFSVYNLGLGLGLRL